MRFLEWKCLNCDSNFTDIYSHWSHLQYDSIGADNGLALNRRQAIIWTNDGQVYWRIYASLCLNELNEKYWLDQIIILHMPRQLSCRGMYKIMTWLCHWDEE